MCFRPCSVDVSVTVGQSAIVWLRLTIKCVERARERERGHKERARRKGKWQSRDWWPLNGQRGEGKGNGRERESESEREQVSEDTDLTVG